MTMNRPPWEITPSLTLDRLVLIATTIADARASAREVHFPEKGDGPWSFGCVAYGRTCFALKGLEASQEHPWLSVKAVGLSCTILFDGEPIKFCTGDPAKPSGRAVQRGLEALTQSRLAFFEEELGLSEGSWCWLLVIDKDVDGTVLRTVLVQVDASGETRNQFEIPLLPTIAVVGNVVSTQREGVDLAPPPVAPKLLEQATGETDGGTDDPT